MVTLTPKAAAQVKAAAIKALYCPGRGRFCRMLREDGSLDETIDSALYSLWRFGMLDATDAELAN